MCVDLGGTHVRFAVASVSAGRVVALGAPTTLQTNDYDGIVAARAAYAAQAGQALPRAASLAIASPIAGDTLKLTNSPWVLRPATLAEELGVETLTLINDFGAVGHAVAQLGAEYLEHVAGPDVPLPTAGVIGVIGPGTGLGVAHVLRGPTGYAVMETEGGHIDWAPLDDFEDALLARLRARFGRVSAERIVSGPGLAHIHAFLDEQDGKAVSEQDGKAVSEHDDGAVAGQDGKAVAEQDPKLVWQAALAGTDRLASAALNRFCQCLGSVAGDIALAQGAHGMVIAGGIGARLAGRLPGSGFAARFTAKGRMTPLLAYMPVKLITHGEPGLFGAAAAFAKEHTI